MSTVAKQRQDDISAAMALDQLPSQQPAYVVGLKAPAHANGELLLRRLAELGFLEGEPVRIVARGIPGGSPIAVRVGSSTFALRPYEARCVLVASHEPE